MFNNLRAALLVPEIRKRIGFVFFAFAWFVFMIHVQLPNVNEARWQRVLQSGAFYNLLGFLSGGALQKLSIIAMGITPYINASIIMQLMTVVLPAARGDGQERRRGRPQKDQPVHALAHDRARHHAGHVHGDLDASARASSTTTSIWYLLFAIIAMVGRHALPDVARRADHATRASATASR